MTLYHGIKNKRQDLAVAITVSVRTASKASPKKVDA
jgi:hypothetical protein